MAFLPVQLLAYAVESDNVLKGGEAETAKSVLRQNAGVGKHLTKIIGDLNFEADLLFFKSTIS